MALSYFQTSLHNFINDFACGDAIRHLADKGFCVSEIRDRLDYPAPIKTIAETVWKHYIDTGIICLDNPPKNGEITKYEYVKDYDKYGRSSMRRITTTIKVDNPEYVLCNYGKQLYHADSEFIEKLNKLSESDRSYVMDLPWPLTAVYHIKNERILRIMSALGEQ